jgi:DNA-directed RNA polymerase specialized sigma24 family protein
MVSANQIFPEMTIYCGQGRWFPGATTIMLRRSQSPPESGVLTPGRLNPASAEFWANADLLSIALRCATATRACTNEWYNSRLTCRTSGDSAAADTEHGESMETAPARKGKWILEQSALDAFLSYLDSDRERAGEGYEKIRRKLLTFFQARGFWNAEDLVDETIDRVVRRLSETEIHALMPFLIGIARKVASEEFQDSANQKRASLDQVGELVQPVGDAETLDEAEQRMRCLENSLALLDAPDREVIVEWFRFEKRAKIENRQRLAESRGASPETLRVQAFRARERLRRLVGRCLSESRNA